MKKSFTIFGQNLDFPATVLCTAFARPLLLAVTVACVAYYGRFKTKHVSYHSCTLEHQYLVVEFQYFRKLQPIISWDLSFSEKAKKERNLRKLS